MRSKRNAKIANIYILIYIKKFPQNDVTVYTRILPLLYNYYYLCIANDCIHIYIYIPIGTYISMEEEYESSGAFFFIINLIINFVNNRLSHNYVQNINIFIQIFQDNGKPNDVHNIYYY